MVQEVDTDKAMRERDQSIGSPLSIEQQENEAVAVAVTESLRNLKESEYKDNLVRQQMYA